MVNDAQILLSDVIGILNSALADVQRLDNLKSRELRVSIMQEISDALRVKLNTAIADLAQFQPVSSDKELSILSGGLIVVRTT